MNIIQAPRRFVKNEWGGTETVILETSKQLLKLGHKTEIICPNILSKREREVIGGINVTRVPYFYPYLGLSRESKSLLDKKGGNIFSFALMKLLKNYPDLDIIHLHTSKRIGGVCRHVAMKRKIPYVVSLHGGAYDVPAEEAKTWTAPAKNSFEWGKALGYWVGSRRVFDDAAAIICVGKREQELTSEKFPDKKVVYFPNGVDTEKFSIGDGPDFRRRYNIPEKAFLSLTVGRIDPQKNQLFPVEALGQMIKEKPDIHLVFIGPSTSAPYHKQLISSIKQKGLNDKVTIINGLDSDSKDLINAYHAADIFCLPSVHEPFGIVILEAWAAGLPVIAGRVGGIVFLTSDGEDAILFDPNDTKDFLEVFNDLYDKPEKRKIMGEQGRAKATEEYGWDKVTLRLEKIYKEVISEYSFR